MTDEDRNAVESADGITKRNPSIPASEEGTGIVPRDGDAGGGGARRGEGDTHLPASEADTGFTEEMEEDLPQSWPGRGGPGTIPPPG